MIYPNFLTNNDTLGICAISQGVGSKLDEYLLSINNLKKHFNIIEAPSVRTNNVRANTAKTRAKELMDMYQNPNINAIICARGGYYAPEIFPYINDDIIKDNHKLFIGYSNPTCFIHYLACKLDIASIYGFNASSFDETHHFTNTGIEYFKGNLLPQHNYDYYKASYNSINYDTKVNWQCIPETFNISGRCIGGCIDDLKNIIGTPYDYTLDFIKRYKDDGIIWYFDNFSLSTSDLYLTLLQFKYAGYFKYTNAIIMGRTCFPNELNGETYIQVLQDIFPDIPVIYNADIGHTSPHISIINGAIMNLNISKDIQEVTFVLE